MSERPGFQRARMVVFHLSRVAAPRIQSSLVPWVFPIWRRAWPTGARVFQGKWRQEAATSSLVAANPQCPC
jgi:hypothetical protein